MIDLLWWCFGGVSSARGCESCFFSVGLFRKLSAVNKPADGLDGKACIHAGNAWFWS